MLLSIAGSGGCETDRSTGLRRYIRKTAFAGFRCNFVTFVPKFNSMPYTYKYPRPAVTVDMLIFRVINGERQLLLIQRDRDPFQGKWALPGGFMDINETLEEAAARELQEETGLTAVELTQLKAYSALDRDPRHRTISVAFWGILTDNQPVRAGDDARKAVWFPVQSIPDTAFDHHQIISDGLQNMGKRAYERGGNPIKYGCKK
jgi:8-oxo-dGTP diphosphatase